MVYAGEHGDSAQDAELDLFWHGTVAIDDGDAAPDVAELAGHYCRGRDGAARVDVLIGPPGATARLEGPDLVLRLPVVPPPRRT